MDLQDVVDDLAARLRRPVEVEDRRYRLLAYSAHDVGDVADDVRTATILQRRAPADVVAWLDGLGLDARAGVLDVPAEPALGMSARACAPLARDGVVLGFLWVIPGERALRDDERAAIAAAAGDACRALWERRARRERRAALVEDLLAGGEDAAAAARALGWPAGAAVRVVVSERAVEELPGSPQVAVAPAPSGGAVLIGPDADALVGGPPVGAAPPAATPARAAASRPVTDLAQLGAALDEARAALLALRADPGLGPVARTEDLGAWPLLAALHGAAGGAVAVAPQVAALDTARDPAALVAAATAFLDHAGDVSAAAAALHVHRVTLYRRLDRVAELTGLDLRRGEDRLLLHVGLRLRALARASS